MNSLSKQSSEKSFWGRMLAVLMITCASTVHAVETPLTAKLVLSPKQCIALHQGQKCYVDIKISWIAQREADFCLFSSQQQQAIMCWTNQNTGTFNREIVAVENVRFHLKQTGRADILGSSEIEMAWVYKKNSRARSSWRMF